MNHVKSHTPSSVLVIRKNWTKILNAVVDLKYTVKPVYKDHTREHQNMVPRGRSFKMIPVLVGLKPLLVRQTSLLQNKVVENDVGLSVKRYSQLTWHIRWQCPNNSGKAFAKGLR